MCRQKRLAKQALSVELSAQSAPTHFADPRYTPDDSAWETVVKKGNKGSKASTVPKPSPPPAPAATASQTLQPQSSGLSQTGRTASGVLPVPLATAQQQPGGVQAPGGGHSGRAKSADPSSGGGDGGLSGDSASMGHMRRISQDEDALSTRSSVVDRSLFQQQSRPDSAESSSAAVQEAAGRAGLLGHAPAAKPSNWAGLLKPQQQQQQDVQQAEASSQKLAPAIVSEGAFPQLSAAAASLPPSQLSLSSEFKPQGPVEADLPSIPGPPFASAGHAHHAHRGPGSNGSETTAESAASEQRSQVHITQQLHANAAIWGTSLSAGTLSGIQLPQQQQISVNPFQAASSASSSSAAAPPAGLWEAQSSLVLPPSSALPWPPSQAPPKPPAATLKSALPIDAQPFIPQAHLSNSASQGQRLPFTHHEVPNQQLGNQPQSGAMLHQQGMPTSGPFMQSHSFSRPQQPPSSASGGYRSNGVFDPLPHPQQQQLNTLNRGLDGNAALQQMQRQRLLQQQQQASLLPRHQQQQQQLADIWLQPSAGLQQNGSASRATGAFATHQQPPNPKGKAMPNGPFAAHQSAAAAFHQQQQQAPFLQQQFNGLHSQPQSRSTRPGLNGSVHGNQYGGMPLNGSGVNGIANGHLSSAGTQSEEDELLSGVFAKVWEDNLQVMQCALHAEGAVTACQSRSLF